MFDLVVLGKMCCPKKLGEPTVLFSLRMLREKAAEKVHLDIITTILTARFEADF